jgi:hypothetical protein
MKKLMTLLLPTPPSLGINKKQNERKVKKWNFYFCFYFYI